MYCPIVRIQRETFTLNERYDRREGDVLLTGVQAIIRVLLDQLRADQIHGLRTAAFVSGYPGSPLGGFDLALQRVAREQPNLRHLPGLNEELAATAVWGSQQDHLAPLKDLDGVIAMWYGKTPGLDRCGDVLRHANLHGTGKNGGVVLAVGDDTSSKSSTLPGACEHKLLDLAIPIFSPGNVQDIIELGRYAFEMSRATGLYAGLKVVTAVADGFGIASIDRAGPIISDQSFRFGDSPWRFVQQPKFFTPDTLEMEKDLYERRIPAAIQFIAGNDINRIIVTTPTDTVGVISCGHTYLELRQALSDLGLSDQDLSVRNIRLLQLRVPYPLEPDIINRFASGLNRIIVVEEKRSFIERQIRELLYDNADRPVIEGKRDVSGRVLFPQDSDLGADRIRPILVRALGLTEIANQSHHSKVSLQVVDAAIRTPFFCSGCPHNRSTQDVTGSPIGAGVGCHAMVMVMDRGVSSYTQMGGEGAQWIGRAPFVDAPHFVQNVGDGTYFHSGCLVPRFAIDSQVSITFKILYNGVIAMTGGQNPTGQIPIPELCRTLLLEGIKQVIIVADDTSRYPWTTRLRDIPRSVKLWDRSRLDEAQRVLAKVKGVTALIYDQACANELRRLRKRKLAPERKTRVIINEAVCEGCGDCGAKSTCLSVQPVDTLLGRKTQIHQESCNTDYSCLQGNCPSFVTVEIGPRAPTVSQTFSGVLANPVLAQIPENGYSIFSVGVGGTGLVTMNQILATAAAFDGLQVAGLDQTGLAQKGGPVASHIRISQSRKNFVGSINENSADLLFALDMVVANEPQHRARLNALHTRGVISSSVVTTSSMVIDTAQRFGNSQQIIDSLVANLRPNGAIVVDFVALAEHIFRDHMPANMIALGVAFQSGALPISSESLESAITVNGAAVEKSLLAFRLGRQIVVDPKLITDQLSGARPGSMDPSPYVSSRARARNVVIESLPTNLDGTLSDLVVLLAAELIDYQNLATAKQYLRTLAPLIIRELEFANSSMSLSRTAALHLFRLMAYKDEYEVARLHLKSTFQADIGRIVPANRHRRYLLQPPILKSLGLENKIRLPTIFAHPTFHILRTMKMIRNTPFDPFGQAEMRKLERSLVRRYCQDISMIAVDVTTDNLDIARRLLELPQMIRGYDSVKLAAVGRFDVERDATLAEFAGLLSQSGSTK